jgi:hypothetical protein
MGRLLVVCMTILWVAGCPSAASRRSPEQAVTAFARALREGRFEDAYPMMSRSYRQRVTLAEFRRHLQENPSEARETAEALGAIEGPIREEAVVEYGDGEEMHLVREDDGWRVSTDLVDFYDQQSPRAALRSFVRAMERGRYDVVLRLVPDADREGMTVERMRETWAGEGREEVQRLIASLRSSLEAPIEVVGDRATMSYGERFTVQFVREAGIWKIEDPD